MSYPVNNHVPVGGQPTYGQQAFGQQVNLGPDTTVVVINNMPSRLNTPGAPVIPTRTPEGILVIPNSIHPTFPHPSSIPVTFHPNTQVRVDARQIPGSDNARNGPSSRFHNV